MAQSSVVSFGTVFVAFGLNSKRPKKHLQSRHKDSSCVSTSCDGPQVTKSQRALGGFPGGAPSVGMVRFFEHVGCEAGEIVEIADIKQGWVRLADAEKQARDVSLF